MAGRRKLSTTPTPQKNPLIDLARFSPAAFCKLLRPKFQYAEHLQPIDETLTKTVYGNTKRVIITMPRRHGKTFLSSETYPLWFLAVNEARGRTVEVSIVSYNQTKANDISRSLRDLFNHPLFNVVFPATKLKEGNEAVDQWSTVMGSKLYAVGVGGSLTGRGSNILVVDDSMKNSEEALSPVYRQKVRDWYYTAGFNSLYEDGVVVHIGTRWHSEDLIGTVLAEDEKSEPEYRENWTVIHQQAIIDEGTDHERPLWPYDPDLRIGFSLDYLKRMRQRQGIRWWSTQYRGIPIDTAEGVLGFPRRGTVNHPLRDIWCYVDTAFDGKDLTAYVIGGINPLSPPDKREVVILYADARRANSVQMAEQIAARCKQYNVRSVLVESNADKGWTGKEIRSKGVHVIDKPQTKNKVGRIQKWVANVYQQLLFSEECTPEFITALSSWSELATHDDCADAVAGLVEHLLGKRQGATVMPPDFFRG